MDIDKKIIIVLVIVAVAVIIYFYYSKGQNSSFASTSVESFTTAGDMQSLGSIEDGTMGNYELVHNGHDSNNFMYPSLDSSLKASDFAELVDGGNQAVQVKNVEDVQRPLERLQNLSDSYFPSIASKALPFSQAAAKPLTFHHAVNLPRFNLKGKLYQMNLSEAVRGTVAINYDPNVSLVAASQYRNEDAFNPGYMTAAFGSLHDKLTGGYKNLPMYIAGAGASSGASGMNTELIMDF